MTPGLSISRNGFQCVDQDLVLGTGVEGRTTDQTVPRGTQSPGPGVTGEIRKDTEGKGISTDSTRCRTRDPDETLGAMVVTSTWLPGGDAEIRKERGVMYASRSLHLTCGITRCVSAFGGTVGLPEHLRGLVVVPFRPSYNGSWV